MGASVRTTILLDPDSRRAAKQLAAKLDVSPSEVIRRALLRYRDELMGGSGAGIRRRRSALDRSLSVFAGVDPGAEVTRMKRDDEGW